MKNIIIILLIVGLITSILTTTVYAGKIWGKDYAKWSTIELSQDQDNLQIKKLTSYIKVQCDKPITICGIEAPTSDGLMVTIYNDSDYFIYVENMSDETLPNNRIFYAAPIDPHWSQTYIYDSDAGYWRRMF